ncbi:hypothetical protein AgCh_027352 [Apium graveolens]
MAMNTLSHNTASFSPLACPILPGANFDTVDGGDFKAVKELDEKEDIQKELIALGALKWRKPSSLSETARTGNKAAKIVNMKVSPRPIQQPR